jgi:predicted dehydrogenase
MSGLAAGVVGVGNMGAHHARVYAESPRVDLRGVHDADRERADSVAATYDVEALSLDELVASVDVASVAVPTRFHHEVASLAIEHGVDVLVEKPLAKDVDRGRDLVERAERRGVTLQVGHVERFNPAVDTVAEAVADRECVAISARRLGPPVDRDGTDDVVLDLMIHDLDIARSILARDVVDVSATGTAGGNYATAVVTFEDGVVGRFTASRVTPRKVRNLTITTGDFQATVDYGDQQVRLHRHSLPEYLKRNGDVLFRHESVVERPTVDSEEPLKREIREFVDAVENGHRPRVTGRDGLAALRLALRIDDRLDTPPTRTADAPKPG